MFEDSEGNIIKSGISNNISNKFNLEANITESIILNNNQYLTTVTINKKTNIPAIIDTGATTVLLSNVLANELGINYKQGNKTNLRTASTKNVYGYLINLDYIQLGKIKLMNIEAIVMDEGEPLEQILLGMSFLKYLELNYSDNRLELTLNNYENANHIPKINNKNNANIQNLENKNIENLKDIDRLINIEKLKDIKNIENLKNNINNIIDIKK